MHTREADGVAEDDHMGAAPPTRNLSIQLPTVQSVACCSFCSGAPAGFRVYCQLRLECDGPARGRSTLFDPTAVSSSLSGECRWGCVLEDTLAVWVGVFRRTADRQCKPTTAMKHEPIFFLPAWGTALVACRPCANLAVLLAFALPASAADPAQSWPAPINNPSHPLLGHARQPDRGRRPPCSDDRRNDRRLRRR